MHEHVSLRGSALAPVLTTHTSVRLPRAVCTLCWGGCKIIGDHQRGEGRRSPGVRVGEQVPCTCFPRIWLGTVMSSPEKSPADAERTQLLAGRLGTSNSDVLHPRRRRMAGSVHHRLHLLTSSRTMLPTPLALSSPSRRMGPSSFQWCPVTGQGAMGTN